MLTKDLIKHVSGEYDLEIVQSLKLTSLELPAITSLESCTNLLHLNLSKNNIPAIGAGLKTLSSLISLDLSCNKLTMLNDSFFGLKSLTTLALEGNELSDVLDINNLDKVSATLTTLYFRSDINQPALSLSNPVVEKESYHDTVLRVLPNLRLLDGESVELRGIVAALGVGDEVQADPKFSVPLETEDWLAGADENGAGSANGSGGGSRSILKDASVLRSMDELHDVLGEVTADVGRAKVVLKAADQELTRLHLL
ncbi:hypothetical protein TeGR_g10782 [Tetraparma gracilis]|uniref:Uncharacterized protein n=1 Tax=Tetraparma gracilis TaxID=2962635 RepID=A0ABQ6MII5_9STRA|nr:hypothetical protein TeGR_g10782 [Tetraparma gracilis]